MKRFLFVLLTIALLMPGMARAQDASIPITSQTVTQIEQKARLGQGHIRGIQWSDAGNLLVLSTIGVWEYAALDFAAPPTIHGEDQPYFYQAATLSPDARWVLTNESGRDTCYFCGFARLWAIETGEELARFDTHENYITSVVFTPDMRRVITASDDKTVRVWDVASSAELAVFDHPDIVDGIWLSADGSFLNSVSLTRPYGYEQYTWNLETYTLALTQPYHRVAGKFSPDHIWQVATTHTEHPDDARRYLNQVQLWEVHSGELKMFEPDFGSPIAYTAFSPDSRWLAVASRSMIKIWRTDTGELIAEIADFYYTGAFALSGDGQTLIRYGANPPHFTIWETSYLELWDPQRLVRLPDDPIRALREAHLAWIETLDVMYGVYARPAITLNDDASLWVVSMNIPAGPSYVCLWTVGDPDLYCFDETALLAAGLSADGSLVFKPGRVETMVWTTDNHELVGRLAAPMGTFNLAAAVSADNRWLAAGFSYIAEGRAIVEPTVSILDLMTGKEADPIQVPDLAGCDGLLFSPDASLLAIGKLDYPDGMILWDMATQTVWLDIDGAEAFTFDPTGDLFVYSIDHTIYFYDLAQARVIMTLDGHTAGITQLAFTDDGTLLVSGSQDGTIRLWTVPTR